MKKKFVSMLLALALVVTGIPSDLTAGTAYAAEVAQEQPSTVLSDEAEGIDGVVESNDASQKALHSEAGDLFAFNVSENGKAIGSDGVVYDDVAYLSADAVNSLNVDAQNAYFAFCDEIAAASKAGVDLNNAVVAVDENGTLVFQYVIPVEALTTAMDELSEEFKESADGQKETETQEEEIASQEEETVDAQATEEVVEETEVVSAEETTVDVDSTEENATEEVVSEEKTETIPDESNVEETTTEELSTEETLPEETVAEESTIEETATEEETETAEEQYVLSAENMELITVKEAEEFPVIENAKADLIVDLGYSSSDIQQVNSILLNADHFSAQLSDNQKTVYNACKGMLKGTNKFKFKATSKLVYNDFCQAISAHILTNPYQCDWMDLSSTGELAVEAWYYSESDPTYDFVVTIGKSKYYNASIVKEANAKVLELAAAAQAYALEKYPQSPVYGIVEYFDNWICKNNYYNNLGVTGGSAKDKETQEIYYYCHSSYGILLKGYGVCESYALAMTRLLDAVGIPNMYATGQALDENGNFIVDANGDLAGGHAWNYVQMPDGKWYLQDSTWNDNDGNGGDGQTSLEYWLLSGDDGLHFPMGNRYKYNPYATKIFDFVKRSASFYEPAKESITLSEKELNLLPKGAVELSCNNEYISNENIPKVWSSSDEKVAKVDKNGKVTAVGAGTAEITLTAAGMSDTCVVNVHQINSITFNNGGKSTLTASGGTDGTNPGKKEEICLTVNQNAVNPTYTAEELKQKGIFDDFKVEYDNKVVTVSSQVSGNEIVLDVTPVSTGKTKITVTFGTKKATLTFSVGKMLNEDWFDLEEVKQLVKDGKEYDGKALKPKVKLKNDSPEKAKFKVSYLNNKDAGTATVLITGTGAYGGELRYDFKINPLTLNVDTGSLKVKKDSNVYNGGNNQANVTVKHKNDAGKLVALKAGKDYEIRYTKGSVTTSTPKDQGEYTMSIVGIGNYAGGANNPVAVPGTWKITENEMKKAKVTINVNGTKPTVTVAIGKNVLPQTDYKITYWKDKDCKEQATAFAHKTKYFVKVEPTSSNFKTGGQIIKNFTTK